MKGKPTASGEQVIINHVFKYFKANNSSDRDHSPFKRTAEATGSFLSTVRRIVQQKDGPKTPGKKRPNRKEEFSKLDEFDQGVIRRIVHEYYARNETFSSKKLQKQLKKEIAFPYSISTLGFVLKKLGFRFKRRQRESIIHERSDLIAWRESFLRRIKEIREKEPERQIVYTDETWLNSGHRVKKEWIDLKALENPRRSIHDYVTVVCTKDPVGRGKRLIIVDCFTEDRPVPGGLWTFSTQTMSKKVKKYDFTPVESAVADEKAREMQKIQKQNDHMEEILQASTSTKNKRKEKSSHQVFVNKSEKKL